MSRILPGLCDYQDARTRLLAQCEADGAVIAHHRHPLAGPDGAALFTDVARFGAAPGDAAAVVMVASGTHGVEGHAGWGLQTMILDRGWHRTLSPGTALVLVSAVNPYGMAWSRRVDHDNIDVNRNFVDFGGTLPANPLYAEVDSLLNPVALDIDDDTWQQDLMDFMGRVGFPQGFRTVSGGQYEYPEGVQFGGKAPSWSRRTLDEIWRDHLAGAATIVNLDIHTGLRSCGGLTIFQTADEGDGSAEAAQSWFPSVARYDRPGTSDELNVGVLGPGLEERVGEAASLVVPVVLEFGTHDVARVLAAMRADNWLHHHGRPDDATGGRIRSDMRDAFFVDDDAWRGAVADAGLETIRAALDAAGGRDLGV